MNLSTEQQQFCDKALAGNNIIVEACIGSGKTTAIQTLCNMFPSNKYILYLTYNKLLKVDAKAKILNQNVTVTNYHGFVYPYLLRNNISCGISEAIHTFTKNKLSIPRFDILIIDEYQDIELDFAEMLEYIKSTNPKMQIIMVGDMSQKIYDKTTLDIAQWAQTFLGNHEALEFTQCFRLQPKLAAKLGRIWNKTINGVNPFCNVREMGKSQVITYISKKKPGDILCLGAKTGPMADVLNSLEDNYGDIYNKNTVYASIRDGDANIEPNENTAIFTTFDSSKGMEKPICIVFDWDESYWATRSRQPDTDCNILRNIFCVAASRGKNEIIFVHSLKHGKMSEMLSETTLKSIVEKKALEKAYVSEMFDFKFIEEVTKAYNMLNITIVETTGDIIDINDKDGMIDISPCIGEYQEVVFFENYNIDEELQFAFSKRDMKTPDLSNYTVEQKILKVVSLDTKQNRYCSQVKLPLITPTEHNAIINRLLTRFKRDETVQRPCMMLLNGITIQGVCDVIKDDVIWELKFTHATKREHFLQLAMYLIMFDKPIGMLWNVRNDELYKVSVDKKKHDIFLKQVYKIITKQKDKLTDRFNNITNRLN